MKIKLFLLVVIIATMWQEIQAQPIPQDTSDIVWQVKPNNSISKIIFSPDSKYVLVGSEGPHGICDGTIEFRDINDGSLIRTIKGQDTGLEFQIYAMTYSKDGRLFANTNRDDNVIIWNTQTWERVQKLNIREDFLLSLDFSPDGNNLAVAAFTQGIFIYDTKTWEIIKKITNFPFKWDPKNGGSPKGYYVKYNQDGTKLLFSGDWAFIYDLSLDTVIHQYPISQTPTYSSDFTKIGIMQRDPAEVFIYNAETYEQVGRITLVGNDNFNFDFSPDGKYVVTASTGETVTIWNIETGIKQYLYKHWLAPHKYVACSIDEKYIAASTSVRLFLLNSRYITGIKGDNDKITKTIYPNPTTGLVKIEFNLSKSENVIFNLFDNFGRILDSVNLGLLESGINSFNYNSTKLTVGVYYFTLQTSSFSETFKLVKE